MTYRGPFPLEPSGAGKKEEGYSEHDLELLDKVAKKVVYWKMSVPAIIALESVKPLNYIGSQAMVFFEPIVQTIFNFQDYDTFRQMLERRESIEKLLLRIEHFDAKALRKEKLFKRLKKEYLKKQSFGFKLKSAILGFQIPKNLEAEWKGRLDALDEEDNEAKP